MMKLLFFAALAYLAYTYFVKPKPPSDVLEDNHKKNIDNPVDDDGDGFADYEEID